MFILQKNLHSTVKECQRKASPLNVGLNYKPKQMFKNVCIWTSI